MIFDSTYFTTFAIVQFGTQFKRKKKNLNKYQQQQFDVEFQNSPKFNDYSIISFISDIDVFGIMRRMFVGVKFTKDSSEGIVVVVLWRIWNACLVAGISTGC